MSISSSQPSTSYTGLHADARPTPTSHHELLPGALFYETDTGEVYIYNGTAWQDMASTRSGVRYVTRVHVKEVAHNGTKVLTAAVALPAGAILEDVRGELLAYSTAATSATMRIGDGDDAQGFMKDEDMTSAGGPALSAPTLPAIGTWGNGGSAVFVNGTQGNFSEANQQGGKRYPSGGTVTIQLTSIDDGTHATLEAYVWVLYAVPAMTIEAA